MRRLVLAGFFALGASPAHAMQWDSMGMISSTLGNAPGRLCVGAGSADLGCPSYAPSVTTTGNLVVSGTVGASGFVGDGSGLTGVVAGSSDRIVSGTGGATSVVAISSTGLVSVTQNGSNTAYFHPQLGLVTVGVSSTGTVSASHVYAGSFGTSGSLVFRDAGGLLTGDPAVVVTASGTLNVPYISGWSAAFASIAANNLSVSQDATVAGTVTAAHFVGDGSGLTNLPLTTDRLTSGTAIVVLNSDGTLAAQNFTAWGAAVTALRAAQVSSTGNITADGDVTANAFYGDGSHLTGIGQGDRITSGTAFVKAVQDQGGEVSGTLKLTSTGDEVCGPSTWYTMRINPTTKRLQMCRP